jgi:hypothetical protein
MAGVSPAGEAAERGRTTPPCLPSWPVSCGGRVARYDAASFGWRRHGEADPADGLGLVTVCVGRGDFAEPVLARGLEVERGQAVEDQREPAAPAGGVGLADIRDDVAVVRSMIRPSTSARNASSRTAENPNAS